MAEDTAGWQVMDPTTLPIGLPPEGGDYRYYEEDGYIQLVLLSERALGWFQTNVFADAFEWVSPVEPKLPWGGETADLLMLMRKVGLQKGDDR